MAIDNDRLEGKVSLVGQAFFSVATFICTLASRAQEVGRCRGIQTPFHLVHEAQP